MTAVRGGPIAPLDYPNEIDTDRAGLWYALGGKQGVIKGMSATQVPGQMELIFTAGAVLAGERAADGTASLDRGYLIWNALDVSVAFGPASVSARNDAVIACAVDTEDGPVGTGGLAQGCHVVRVPGVSGTTSPRTDTQINAFVGRGGWVRLLDVPIAAGSTEINLAGATVTVDRVRDTGWINLASSLTSGTFRYRVLNGMVTVHIIGQFNSDTGITYTLNTGNIPIIYRPAIAHRFGAYFGTYPGTLTVNTDGTITAVHQAPTTRTSVAGTLVYPVE